MTCAASKDSDQPGHLPSLIRVFAVRMKKAWVLSYSLSAQRRLWSDWADAQADLSFSGRTPILFVVSCRGSYIFCFLLMTFITYFAVFTMIACSSHWFIWATSQENSIFEVNQVRLKPACSARDWLESWNFGFNKYMYRYMHWASSWDYGIYHIGDQRRLRRDCADEPSLFAHISRRVRPKIRHLAPTGWLHMRVWRMSLRRTKSAIISWAGSIVLSRQWTRRWSVCTDAQADLPFCCLHMV